jgi:hypothetical protein
VTDVWNLLTSANGRPLQNHTVKIHLVAPGNPFTSLAEVIQTHAVDTGTDGRWDAELIPNDEYEREGTWYRVDQRDGLLGGDYVHDIVVPSTGGPYWVRDLIVIPPAPGEPFPPLPPHALGDHTDVDTTGAVVGRVLKYDGTNWVPAVDSGGGGTGSGFEMAVTIPAQSVSVPHGLGYKPAGVRLFSTDWLTEYAEFHVFHDSDDLCTVIVEQLFSGNITVS